MLDYETTPGIADSAPSRWPSGTPIQPVLDRATLIMLAHPHCPCTRASIGELAGLMAHVQDRLTAYVLFLQPEEFPDGWEKTDLWESAAAIPGVQVFSDKNGREARRFHATVSGQTLVYDAYGRLVFSRSITGSRGHAGDNAGRSAIFALLTGEAAEPKNTFIFGCSLLSDHGGEKQKFAHEREKE